jgi:hypothetical protein
VLRGATTLLRTNKKKETTIENEHIKERRGTTTASDFDKMKEKWSGNSYW